MKTVALSWGRIAVAALVLGRTMGAMDLTPTLQEYTNEGISFRQLILRDGDRRISYEPPQKWSCQLLDDCLKFLPPVTDRAEGEIRSLSYPIGSFVDENGTAVLKQHFLERLPPDAQFVAIRKELPNALAVRDAQTYEINASYQTLGETFVAGAVFVKTGDTELVFRLTARKAEFDKLYAAFRGSITSWQVEARP